MGCTETRMSRFQGMHASTFWLHIEESMFASNRRDHDLYNLLLRLCRESPLSES
jgi:hypothetical protein